MAESDDNENSSKPQPLRTTVSFQSCVQQLSRFNSALVAEAQYLSQIERSLGKYIEILENATFTIVSEAANGPFPGLSFPRKPSMIGYEVGGHRPSPYTEPLKTNEARRRSSFVKAELGALISSANDTNNPQQHSNIIQSSSIKRQSLKIDAPATTPIPVPTSKLEKPSKSFSFPLIKPSTDDSKKADSQDSVAATAGTADTASQTLQRTIERNIPNSPKTVPLSPYTKPANLEQIPGSPSATPLGGSPIDSPSQEPVKSITPIVGDIGVAKYSTIRSRSKKSRAAAGASPRSGLKKLISWLFLESIFQDTENQELLQTEPMRRRSMVKEEMLVGLHPMSRFNTVWELFISGVYFYTVIEIPIIASFDKSSADSGNISSFLTVIFGIATLLNFVTLEQSKGILINDLKSAALKNLTRGFTLDLIASLPFDLIFRSYDFSYAFHLLRLLHVRRIFRIFRRNALYALGSQLVQKTFRVGTSFMGIFLLLGILLTYLHIHGCSIFLLGRFGNYDAASWQDANVLPILGENMSFQYIWAFFQTVSNTFAMTGYQPSDPYEQIFSIIAALIGAILYAVLVGTISAFSFGLDSSGRKYKEKLDEVNEYMAYRKLDDDLKDKIRQYYELKYKGKYFDEDAILNEMNESLKQEIAVHNCRDLIAKVAFLNRDAGDGRDAHFLARIAKALRPVYYITGDLIFDQGWVGNEMYFIQKGSVKIIVNGNTVGQLKDGAFFGEVALLSQTPRTATIIAAENTVLYSFGRADFSMILEDYEDMAARIKLVYEERIAKIQKEKEEKQKLLSQKSMDSGS